MPGDRGDTGDQQQAWDAQSSSAASQSSQQSARPPPPATANRTGQRQRNKVEQHSNIMHQPHGVAAIGPSASTISVGTSLSQQHHAVSVESPLPPLVQRSLGDRSNEKRKNAALEIEALVKTLHQGEPNSAMTTNMIQRVIAVLSKDFCTSMNSNYRKGGLVGLAATAIGLAQSSSKYLHVLLPPVLHCFDDPESRVRYYACESLYNIAKVSREAILQYFNQVFEGLTKLFADVDADVKNGANLLDGLMKDIVTEAESFQVDQFLPLLQNYIRRTNPFIRQLIVGWITLLDSVPDINMLDFLPDFLDGLFNMLSDGSREIRQAADSALADFLRELGHSKVVEFGPIVSILVFQCRSKERLNRLTAVTWLSALIHHPYSGRDALLPFHSEILGAVLWCISDEEMEIRLVAERTNQEFLGLVRETRGFFELKPLLDTLIDELLYKEDVPTKMAALGWINMLMEKCKSAMIAFVEDLLPVLLRTLSDPSDDVVLLNLQVLSRISLSQTGVGGAHKATEEAQFQLVLNAILDLFAKDRQLLETRGSLIIRKLCVLLNAQSVYMRLADALLLYEADDAHNKPDGGPKLEFVSTMVQTLNLILLTASELSDLRSILAKTMDFSDDYRSRWMRAKKKGGFDSPKVFETLFRCWCHNPVATFSLCLLARAYDLSFSLVKRFSQMEDVTVGFLMQIDKLVYLLESPIFVHLRLQLLDVESKHHAALLKSVYGILLCLPQGEAFRLLNNRLATVCNLRESLGLAPLPMSDQNEDSSKKVSKPPINAKSLLTRFDDVIDIHQQAREHSSLTVELPEQQFPANGGSFPESEAYQNSATGGNIRVVTSSSRSVDSMSPRRNQRSGIENGVGPIPRQ